MVEADFDNLTIFDSIEVLEAITIDDVKEQRKYFNLESVATFTIFPRKEKKFASLFADFLI